MDVVEDAVELVFGKGVDADHLFDLPGLEEAKEQFDDIDGAQVNRLPELAAAFMEEIAAQLKTIHGAHNPCLFGCAERFMMRQPPRLVGETAQRPDGEALQEGLDDGKVKCSHGRDLVLSECFVGN